MFPFLAFARKEKLGSNVEQFLSRFDQTVVLAFARQLELQVGYAVRQIVHRIAAVEVARVMLQLTQSCANESQKTTI